MTITIEPKEVEHFLIFLCFTVAVIAMLAATLLGDPQMTLSIMMPLALLAAAMFFTSMLFTVKDCFSTAEPPSA